MMKSVKAAIIATVVLGTLLAIGESDSGTSNRAEAAARVYPIVDTAYGFLLGGTSGGSWASTDAMSNTVAGGETYRVYSLGGYLGRASGSGAPSAGAPCHETRVVDLTPSYASVNAIASGGPWAAMPRLPKSLSTRQPVYVKAVGDLLKARGIAAPRVRIEQVLQVDLEGDRVNEVLVSASYFAGSDDNEPLPSTEVGDYSIVFMRKLVAGKVETVVLAEDIQAQRIEFAAPLKFDIAGVLDVNGDGVLELVLHVRYYEGIGSSVVEIKGTQHKEVLSAGCGA
jgi:hypothetical protein